MAVKRNQEKHPNYVTCPQCGRKGTKVHQLRTKKKGDKTYGPYGPFFYVYHKHNNKLTSCYIGKVWPETPSDTAINHMIEAGTARSREEAVKLYQEHSFEVIKDFSTV